MARNPAMPRESPLIAADPVENLKRAGLIRPEPTKAELDRLELWRAHKETKAGKAIAEARDRIAGEHAEDLKQIEATAGKVNEVDEKIFQTVRLLWDQIKTRRQLSEPLAELLHEARSNSKRLGLPEPSPVAPVGPFPLDETKDDREQIEQWLTVVGAKAILPEVKLADLRKTVKEIKQKYAPASVPPTATP